MKPFRCLLVSLILTLVAATAAWADYGAIAYSNSSGKYGYSYGCSSRSTAERLALNKCAASDRRIVVWVSKGWAALAVNDANRWGTGWSTKSRAAAERIALSKCGGANPRILCWINSGK